MGDSRLAVEVHLFLGRWPSVLPWPEEVGSSGPIPVGVEFLWILALGSCDLDVCHVLRTETDACRSATNIYTHIHVSRMAHKTLTISEEAYNALARLKSKDESFTKVIIRLAQKKSKGSLLEYLKTITPDHELADKVEEVLKERRKIRLGER